MGQYGCLSDTETVPWAIQIYIYRDIYINENGLIRNIVKNTKRVRLLYETGVLIETLMSTLTLF